MTRAMLLVLLATLLQPAVAAAQAPDGRELYVEGCSSCHGLEAQGIPGEGPPLLGVGAASVDLYLTTGYMPLDDPGDQPLRTRPAYGPDEIAALVDYLTALPPGGGPPIPDVDPSRGDVAEGQELFAEFCAGCHQAVGEGGVVVGGVAPGLDRSTATQIGEAIRVGPYLMPRFDESLLSDAQVDSIARYVIEEVRTPEDEGGWGIGHIGPVPEGIVAWLLAGAVLILIARLLGERQR